MFPKGLYFDFANHKGPVRITTTTSPNPSINAIPSNFTKISMQESTI